MKAGEVLADRYELMSLIATGGMGTVFEARDVRLERVVAVKMLRSGFSDNETLRERFRREARAAAALSHPNIAAVFDYGEADGEPYIVMELCRGTSLAAAITRDGALAPERAAFIGAQIADALEHAHAAGVIHRDVKPSNVMVDDKHHVKVMDFGIARAVGDSTLTGAGVVFGSAHYMAPEQASGDSATPASDIYGLGVVLYEMLTGTAPFTGDSPLGIAARHVNEQIPRPSSANPDAPPALDAVVARATAKKPEERYRDAAALATALRGAVAGAGAEDVSPTDELPTTIWPIPGSTWDPQRLGRAVIAGLLALLVLAAALLLLRPNRGAERNRSERRPAAAPSAPAEKTDAATATMPDVTGLLFKDLKDQLEAQGYKVVEEKGTYEGIAKDVVVDSAPPVGTPLVPGQTITLFVSDGKAAEEDEEEEDKEDKDEDDHPGKGNAYGRDDDD